MTVNDKLRKFRIHAMALLEQEGFQPYIITEAQTGSCYIGFRDCPSIGQLRIADHPERSQYSYRWHLRYDMDHAMVLTNKGHKQYFYPVPQVKKLVEHMRNYRDKAVRHPQQNDKE